MDVNLQEVLKADSASFANVSQTLKTNLTNLPLNSVIQGLAMVDNL